MAQSALTVTPENPTPPTNLSFVGTTPPTDPAQAYADDGYTSPGANTTVFAAKTAAAGSGTSVDHEGRGTETSVTITNPATGYQQTVPTIMVGCGPAYSVNPNQNHASSLSPAYANNPTLSSVSAGGASGTGNATCTATGVGFTRQSVLNINGINYPTTFVSSTSLTASAPKKATAGNLPVVVITGGVVQTAPQNWVFT
jgi:hypothetical protein